MVKIRKHTHFVFWDLHRRGLSQIEIAKQFSVSRQAVSKSLKNQNHKILVKLLQLAHSIGAYTEWQDENRGLLVGIVPQLENKICLVLIDQNEIPRVFYGGKTDQEEYCLDDKYQTELIACLTDCLDLTVESNSPLKNIINQLISSRR